MNQKSLNGSAESTNATHASQCPICNGQLRPWRTVDKGAGAYQFDRCAGCGYCLVNPRPSREAIAEAYSVQGHGHETIRKASDDLGAVMERERAHPNSTLDAHRIVATISRLLEEGSGRRFLDIGCGYGFFSREAIAQGFSVVPLEMAATERGIAASLLGFEPLAASFEDYECSSGEFDVVLMSHVLEHVYDVNEWIAKASRLLKPGGVCAVALPNFDSIVRLLLGTGDPFICPPMHLNHFNSRNLSQLMLHHGLAVRQVQWASRIPMSAFSRRLPASLRSLAVVPNALASLTLSACDCLGFGMATTVYAMRERG